MKPVVGSIAVGLLACMLAVAGASAQQFTIKISSPTANDVTQEWMKTFKSGVEGRSKGRIKVEMYPANQLGQIPATVEGVALGTIEIVIPASGFFVGLEPRFAIFDVPGLFEDMAHAQRVLANPEIRKRLAGFGAAKGVEPLAAFPHSPLMVLSHKPIRAVADFRGQKIRVPGSSPLHIEPIKKLGASPLSMPLGEVVSAMQNRAIDGFIGGATVFTAFKYYDIAKGLTALPNSFVIVVAGANRDFLKSARTRARSRGARGGGKGAGRRRTLGCGGCAAHPCHMDEERRRARCALSRRSAQVPGAGRLGAAADPGRQSQAQGRSRRLGRGRQAQSQITAHAASGMVASAAAASHGRHHIFAPRSRAMMPAVM